MEPKKEKHQLKTVWDYLMEQESIASDPDLVKSLDILLDQSLYPIYDELFSQDGVISLMARPLSTTSAYQNRTVVKALFGPLPAQAAALAVLQQSAEFSNAIQCTVFVERAATCLCIKLWQEGMGDA